MSQLNNLFFNKMMMYQDKLVNWLGNLMIRPPEYPVKFKSTSYVSNNKSYISLEWEYNIGGNMTASICIQDRICCICMHATGSQPQHTTVDISESFDTLNQYISSNKKILWATLNEQGAIHQKYIDEMHVKLDKLDKCSSTHIQNNCTCGALSRDGQYLTEIQCDDDKIDIKCDKCGYHTSFLTRARAISKWNRDHIL